MAQTKTKITAYPIFFGLAVLLLLLGVLFSGYASSGGSFAPPNMGNLLNGYKLMLTHPSMIDFDALKQAGQFGSAFFNSGILLAIVFIVYKLTNTSIQGVQIAAAMMVLGFSFYGKNPINIWFPIIGVLLHTKLSAKPINSATALAFFSTALSPIFSQLAFGMADKYMLEQVGLAPATVAAYALGGAMGILAGVLLSVIAGHLPSLHQGYVLFNAGYAAGLAGFIINSLLKAAGLGHDAYRAALYATSMQSVQNGPLPGLFANAPHAAALLADEKFNPSYMTAGDNGNFILGAALLLCFLYLVVAGLLLGGGAGYGGLFWHKAKGGNCIEQFGLALCLINMGVVGSFALAFVFLTVKGQLGGPVFACIFTAVGFASNGVTIRMYLPNMLGVFLGAFALAGVAAAISGGDFFAAGLAFATSRGMLLAAIFSCGLCPIVGAHGVWAGLFVGILHSLLVVNVGVLHGFMSLYNNGLSLSLIATFLYPLYSKFGAKKGEVAKAA